MLNIGIVGLPNVGKSTLFNALSRGRAQVANYPFTTIDPNVGVATVPDDRLDKVAHLAGAAKVTPATVQFVDIAGLVRGASRGEGLGNKFLSHIREVDAIAHVVRCFEDPNVSHVDGRVDPARDIETIRTELTLADIETVGKRLSKLESLIKTGDKKYGQEMDTLLRLRDHLNDGNEARSFDIADEERGAIDELHLLTAKPVMYIANLPEEEAALAAGGGCVQVLAGVKSAAGNDPVVPICAELESQLAELSSEDAAEYLMSLGMSEPALSNVVRVGYSILDLITFFTIKGPESRAWTVCRGTLAPAAAGKIHSDMERGFIKAEVIAWRELLDEGSFASAREHGKLRVEGRDYVVHDGDVILFRFNV